MNVPIWIIQGICIVLSIALLSAEKSADLDGPEGCIPSLIITGTALSLVFYAGHLWH